ncbi:MAG: Hsp20/alpha crystallin family protein [Candidatus Nitrosotenuis sp.]|nr:Hsp20/alpha crystallin family protein [Candidatus Nitrosotenuis sp.]
MTKPDDKQKTELVPFWPTWPNMDRAFDNFRRDLEKSFTSFPAMSTSFPSIKSMSCDVIDEGDKYLVKLEMPGVKKDEINLNVSDNSIEISAQHKEEEEEKKKNYLRKERSEISYYRTLPLPEKVLSDKTQAKLTDGILNVTIPKAVPTSKPKKNPIQVQ